MTGGLPSQRASSAVCVSIPWRHHGHGSFQFTTILVSLCCTHWPHSTRHLVLLEICFPLSARACPQLHQPPFTPIVRPSPNSPPQICYHTTGLTDIGHVFSLRTNSKSVLYIHMYILAISNLTVSVRSGVLRHNQDSVGTRGLHRHNKTSLLAQTVKMTSTENVPGIK